MLPRRSCGMCSGLNLRGTWCKKPRLFCLSKCFQWIVAESALSATAWHKVRSVVPDNYSASSIWKHLASISAIKHVVKWRKSPFERPLNKKKIRNDVTTGNASEVAAITLFLFLCCDNNLGKRDYTIGSDTLLVKDELIKWPLSNMGLEHYRHRSQYSLSRVACKS